MQVQKVQTNNLNFGMALKIHPNAIKKISNKGEEYVNMVAEVGNDLKNCKYVDMGFDKYGELYIKDKFTIKNISDIKKSNNDLLFIANESETDNIKGSNTIYNGGKYFEKLSKMDTLHKYAELTKILNKQRVDEEKTKIKLKDFITNA